VPRSFGLTFDYRCPYGRIAHDHVVTGLRAGADWNVTFLPFCLGQAHVEEGSPDIWDAPERDSGLLALQIAISLRDNQPDSFLDVHHALYEHRHTGGGSLTNKDVLREIITNHGGNPDAAFDDVASGRPLAVVREEHTKYAKSHHVWGVPVFIVDDKAVFVRLMSRANGDSEIATSTVNRILDNIDWPILNEFKHTSVAQ
jgi:hypothetical protein